MGRRAAVFAALAAAALGALAAVAADVPWIDERISTAGDTDGWSRDVLYNRTYATAVFDGGEYVYTPNAASDGRFVTVETVTTFPVCETSAPLDREAQAAICLGKNGSFKIWAGGNGSFKQDGQDEQDLQDYQNHVNPANHVNPVKKTGRWIPVSAPGVAAVAGREYTLSFVFDYENGVYSVAVKGGPGGGFVAFRAENGAKTFPLAAKKTEIAAISYDGYTTFRSLKGSQTDEGRSKIRTAAAFHYADPNRIPAALASMVFGATGIPTEAKTGFLASSQSRRPQKPSSLAPSESGRTFCHPTTGPPESRRAFRRPMLTGLQDCQDEQDFRSCQSSKF